MSRQRTDEPSLVVVTAQSELLEQVLAVTAAVEVEPLVLPDVGGLGSLWAQAGMVLVGLDRADEVAGQLLPRRTGVYLVGQDGLRTDLHAWSLRLGAAVVTLPDGASWLAAALADGAQEAPATGRLVGVVGGSGGVGASTLAAGLALVAARSGARTMLVDADPVSGGLDLLLGAEEVAGWRWPRLAGARGHLGDLGGQLPEVDGVHLLSMGRGEAARPRTTGGEPLAAVLRSALRSHRFTVVDLPRAPGAGLAAAVRLADLVLLVARADVRGVAAAREVLLDLEPVAATVGLVVRQGRSHGLDPDTVATGLELELLGVLTHDDGLVQAAERGEPPVRSGRGSLARSCRTVLAQLGVEERAA